jgi:3-oxoacyl-[acyl-carrier protein] reductase
LKKLADKVALITGGTRGIGRAISVKFAEEGAKVILNYLNNDFEAKKTVEHIYDKGGLAKSIKADISNKKIVDGLAQNIISEFGRVDILVNNAGILINSDLFSFDEKDLDLMLGTNLKGVFFCTKSIAPYMIKNNYGKIINLSSIAGLGTAAENTTSYAATKASIIVLTKRFALELGSYGINVNAIAPGLIKTDMVLRGKSPELANRIVQYCIDNSVLHRVGTPNDIANVALFLASEDSDFITGQIISVDGGRKDFITYSM